MKITIQKLKKTHIPAFVRCIPRDEVLELVASKSVAYGAFYRERPCGALIIKPLAKDRELRVSSFFVQEEYRGKGVFRALMEAIAADMKKIAKANPRLTFEICWPDMMEAAECLEHFGFKAADKSALLYRIDMDQLMEFEIPQKEADTDSTAHRRMVFFSELSNYQKNKFYEGFKQQQFPKEFDPRNLEEPLLGDFSVAVIEDDIVRSFLICTEHSHKELYIAALYGKKGLLGDAFAMILKLLARLNQDPTRFQRILFVTVNETADRLARGFFANTPVQLQESELVLFSQDQ